MDAFLLRFMEHGGNFGAEPRGQDRCVADLLSHVVGGLTNLLLADNRLEHRVAQRDPFPPKGFGVLKDFRPMAIHNGLNLPTLLVADPART